MKPRRPEGEPQIDQDERRSLIEFLRRSPLAEIEIQLDERGDLGREDPMSLDETPVSNR